MRIALMTNNYKPIMGGVPISIERLAKGLRDMGHQVTIFAPTYGEDRQTDEEGVFRYAVFLKHFIGGIVLPNPYDRRIEEEFAKNNYDIIHVHHPMLIGRMAVYLSRKYNIPLVFTYHTRYEQYAKCYTKGIVRLDKIMPLYLHVFLKHCNYVFAPTAGMWEYLVNECGMAPEKTGILPTGIEVEDYEAGNCEVANYEAASYETENCEAANYETGNYEAATCEKKNCETYSDEIDLLRKSVHAERIPLLLTVSRMAQEKNIEFLLESLALVKEYYKKPFRMLMVGDGPDREALEKKCAKLGLADYVTFTGAVPNERIAPYFKAADMFLFASKTETQGIVILEAFAGKTPVIAVRASGVEDLVEDGRNGFLTIEEPHVYAAQLTAVLQGAYNRRVLGENARRTAENYREDAVARKAVCYYNSIIDNAVYDNIVYNNVAIDSGVMDKAACANVIAERRWRSRKVWRGYRNGAEISHFSG